jgi:hypothetical protein
MPSDEMCECGHDGFNSCPRPGACLCAPATPPPPVSPAAPDVVNAIDRMRFQQLTAERDRLRAALRKVAHELRREHGNDYTLAKYIDAALRGPEGGDR